MNHWLINLCLGIIQTCGPHSPPNLPEDSMICGNIFDLLWIPTFNDFMFSSKPFKSLISISIPSFVFDFETW